MNPKEFDKFVLSIKQAGKIRRGEMKAGRVTDYPPVDVRSIRERLGKSHSDFA